MRKRTLLFLSALAIAIPLSAEQGRSQSYVSYDEGGTIIRQAEDGREIDARVNLPVYAGDEVMTTRRGRSEIRLADGNILALDRSTDIHFRSINDSYDTDAEQTIVELRYGHVAVLRTDFNRQALRLDTESASYVASDQAVYSVETDSRNADHVIVFDGEIEVRTPAKSSRLRAGEEGSVDAQGLYGLATLRDDQGTDDFERWFLQRSERYRHGTSRYLEGSLAYSDSELDQYGSWTYVGSLGTWGWRPYAGAGWRPYYNGYWMYGPSGCLVWISYEPWGWVPYHYGRWVYDGLYGWIWIPGYTYSPAWVYWIYGPGYFGWAPAGWFDCYRPYYGWAYRPYARAGFDFGFGFYGRVHLNEIDLRPWTFVSPNNIVSTRVDRAALTADAIRDRLRRDPSAGLATVGAAPARFTRSEIRDPAAAISTIARRGFGSGTGREGSGSAVDMTSFFRRDPELSNTIRQRIVRSAVPVPAAGGAAVVAPAPRFGGSGVPSPGTPGTLEGQVPPRSDRSEGGRVDRSGVTGRDQSGTTRPAPAPAPAPPPQNIDRGSVNWRDRVERPAPSTPAQKPPTIDRSSPPPPDDSWRGRTTGRRDSASPSRDSVAAPRDGRAPAVRAPADGSSDIPRRIIDRIGGARIYGDTPRSNVPRESAPVESAPRERAAPPPPRESPPPRIERSSPPPPRERSSSPPPSHSSGGGGGGHVRRH